MRPVPTNRTHTASLIFDLQMLLSLHLVDKHPQVFNRQNVFMLTRTMPRANTDLPVYDF